MTSRIIGKGDLQIIIDERVTSEMRFVYDYVVDMNVGECRTFDRHLFENIFMPNYGPFGLFLPDHAPKNAIDVFMRPVIGGAWGRVRLHQDEFRGDYTISIHEYNGKRYYADPDRQHWFDKKWDGEMILKDEYRVRKTHQNN